MLLIYLVVKRLKHDRYVQELCDLIAPEYDQIFRNVEFFSQRKRKIAEADIIAVKDDGLYVYEVKCSYRIIKAKRQLHKISRLLPNIKKLLFYCGASKAIVRL